MIFITKSKPCDNYPMESVKDRLRGIALGAAIGDALGMPLEFLPAREINNLATDMLDARLPAGTFTDDTEMALALAESLLARTPLDGADLMQRFVHWYHGNPPDIGIHTSRVLSLAAEGTPWQEAAKLAQQQSPGIASNGSLMRCWPISVAYWDNPDLLRSEARLQSEITHLHPDCVDACLFLNMLLQQLVNREGDLPSADIFKADITQVINSADFSEEIRALVEQAPVSRRESLPNTGYVRHTLESALWAVSTTNSFEDALIQAVNLGDDADTTGSVAGAIAGALYGATAIPERWSNQVRGVYPINKGRVWRAADFIELADSLSNLG